MKTLPDLRNELAALEKNAGALANPIQAIHEKHTELLLALADTVIAMSTPAEQPPKVKRKPAVKKAAKK